jgi:7-carboxy-7-deazaguanine synthase
MRINELFYSLQGEGRLAGTPSVFIRVSGCPLRCRWCDTSYAWAFDAGTEQSAETLLSWAAEYPTRHMVLTGGEPLVQEGLGAFLRVFSEADILYNFGDGGISVFDANADLSGQYQPQLSNSAEGTPEAERLNLAAILQLMQSYSYQLKFVVDQPEDLNEIADCIERLGTVDPSGCI